MLGQQHRHAAQRRYTALDHAGRAHLPSLQAGIDASDLGITQTRSTPADWAAQVGLQPWALPQGCFKRRSLLPLCSLLLDAALMLHASAAAAA